MIWFIFWNNNSEGLLKIQWKQKLDAKRTTKRLVIVDANSKIKV